MRVFCCSSARRRTRPSFVQHPPFHPDGHLCDTVCDATATPPGSHANPVGLWVDCAPVAISTAVDISALCQWRGDSSVVAAALLGPLQLSHRGRFAGESSPSAPRDAIPVSSHDKHGKPDTRLGPGAPQDSGWHMAGWPRTLHQPGPRIPPWRWQRILPPLGSARLQCASRRTSQGGAPLGSPSDTSDPPSQSRCASRRHRCSLSPYG
jgi:hypothetical protein